MHKRIIMAGLIPLSLSLLFLACDGGTGTDEDGTTDAGPNIELGQEDTLAVEGGGGTPDTVLVDPEKDTVEIDSCETDADCQGENTTVCYVGACLAGSCVETALLHGTGCDDSDPCTLGESCDGEGNCIGGTPTGTPECTEIDEDPCSGLTEGDPCLQSDCCATATICSPCEDPENCPASEFVCGGGESPCSDSEECTLDLCTCEEGTPVCSYEKAEDGTECDYNSNDCTTGDSCLGGQCLVGEVLPLDDGNPCTKDLCIKGSVDHEQLLEGTCDDGNECTTDDTCYLGTCIGDTPIECENPPCASATACVEGEGCVSSWMPSGASCDDGDSCTSDDACDGTGVCVPGVLTICDDENPCTLDTCGATTGGCTYEEMDIACDDGSKCTVADFCEQGVCQGQPVDCSYLDATCTLGICLNGNCLIQNLNTGCDDENPLTCSDTCYEGYCAGVDCTSCAFDGQSCDDGDLCTWNDVCENSICQGEALDCSGLNSQCGLGYCEDGDCVTQELGGTCNDGNFNTCDDACESGECVGEVCSPDITGGETCESAVDMADGGIMQFNLCDYQNNGATWCGNQGPDFYVKLKAQKESGSMKMVLIQGFPSLIVNYRFYNQGMCEQLTDWYCYYNGPATVGWGGYDPEWDVYLSFGSTDGTCGIVEFSVDIK